METCSRYLDTNLHDECRDVLEATATGVCEMATQTHSAGWNKRSCEHKMPPTKTQIKETSENGTRRKNSTKERDRDSNNMQWEDRKRPGQKTREKDRANTSQQVQHVEVHRPA